MGDTRYTEENYPASVISNERQDQCHVDIAYEQGQKKYVRGERSGKRIALDN